MDAIERDAGSGPPLRRIQRLNLSISLVIRQWMQVLVVSAGVGLFFVAFGMLAISAHIFADDLRGTAEGHGPWDLVKEPNTMTNATVAEIEEVGDQRELKVSYKQGEGEHKTEGTQTIYVPDDLSVVKMEKASDRSVLEPGKKAFLVVRDDAGGTRTVLAVVVGEEGATPPM